MFESVIGALSVEITADAKGVESGVKAAGNALAIGSKELRKSANQFGKWALAGTTAAAAIGVAIVNMQLSAVRDLKNISFAANTTVEEFQRGAFAADQFGISTEKYGDILKDVTERVGDFLTEGAGPMTRFFEQVAPKIGITADAFRGLSGQQALGLYIKSLEDANLSQQEMTVFMEDIASDSTRLIPLFRDNAKALKEMTKEAIELGIGLSDIDVEKIEQANRKLSASKASTDAMTKQLTVELAPIISAVTDLFTDMAKNAGGASNFISEGIGNVVDVVGVFADGLHGINIVFKTLEVAAIGFSAAAVAVFQVVTNVIATSIDGWIMLTNEAVKAINDVFDTDLAEIPDVRSSSFVKSVNEVGDTMIGLVSQTNAELHALAMEKLPSEQIKEFVAEAQAEFQKLAEITVQTRKDKDDEDKEEAPGQSVAEFEEAERIRLENEEILKALVEQGQMREETLIGRLERERDILTNARAMNLLSEEEFAAASIALAERTESTKLNIISSTLDAIGQAISIGGKKSLKVQEKIAVISAVIKGKEAAVSAWAAGMSTGGPFAPLVAASYTAASLVKTAGLIKSIKSRSSSSGGGSGGGSSRTPSSGGGSGGSSSSGQSNVQSPRNITINMTGSGLLSTDQVRELIGQINEQAGDGVTIITE